MHGTHDPEAAKNQYTHALQPRPDQPKHDVTYPLIPPPHRTLLTLLAAVMLLAGCGETPPAHVLEGEAFGTRYELQLTEPIADPQALQNALEARLAAIDEELSTWRTDSTIATFNRQQTTDWFELTPAFAAALDGALDLSRDTGGALDITLAPLFLAWGLRGEGTQRTPEDAELDALLRHVGMHRLERASDRPALRKRDPRIEIDLTAVATGYAVDEMTSLIRDFGASDFLVTFGDELHAEGERPGGGPWQLSVPTPGTEPTITLLISGRSIATSGDFQRSFIVDGQPYAHVIHPVSGRPPENGVASVTVLADTTLEADGLATAFMVLEPEATLVAAERLGVGVRLVLRSHEGLRYRANAVFKSARAQEER